MGLQIIKKFHWLNLIFYLRDHMLLTLVKPNYVKYILMAQQNLVRVQYSQIKTAKQDIKVINWNSRNLNIRVFSFFKNI